jgi:hypothetical protein
MEQYIQGLWDDRVNLLSGPLKYFKGLATGVNFSFNYGEGST